MSEYGVIAAQKGGLTPRHNLSSFSREDLLKRLANVIEGKFEMPDEEELDERLYRATYIKEARIIMNSIEKGGLD